MRFDIAGKIDHFRRNRRFQIHTCYKQWPDRTDIGIFNMTPVFAQMKGNRIGSRLLCHDSGFHGIGIRRSPRIAKGGDMIDIDAQFDDRTTWI